MWHLSPTQPMSPNQQSHQHLVPEESRPSSPNRQHALITTLPRRSRWPRPTPTSLTTPKDGWDDAHDDNNAYDHAKNYNPFLCCDQPTITKTSEHNDHDVNKINDDVQNAHGDQDANVANDSDDDRNVCVVHNTEVDGFLDVRLRDEGVTDYEEPKVLRSSTLPL